jgi:hypothetical protein
VWMKAKIVAYWRDRWCGREEGFRWRSESKKKPACMISVRSKQKAPLVPIQTPQPLPYFGLLQLNKIITFDTTLPRNMVNIGAAFRTLLHASYLQLSSLPTKGKMIRPTRKTGGHEDTVDWTKTLLLQIVPGNVQGVNCYQDLPAAFITFPVEILQQFGSSCWRFVRGQQYGFGSDEAGQTVDEQCRLRYSAKDQYLTPHLSWQSGLWNAFRMMWNIV